MNNIDLSAFITVAETGSIKSAAQSLFVSESTLSRRVSSLERDLGVELFVRSRTGATLTDEGRQLLEGARSIVDATGQLQEMARALAAQSHPTLRVGYIGWSYEELGLVLGAKATARRFPNLEVDFRMDKTAEILDKLGEGSLDAALLFNDSLPENHAYRVREVGTSHPIAILPRDHPLAKRASVTMAELGNETFLSEGAHPGSIWDERYKAELRALGASHCEVRPIRSYKSVTALVAAGQGIGIANKWMSNPFPKFVSYVPIEEERYLIHLYFVWRPDVDPTLATVFASELEAELAALCE